MLLRELLIPLLLGLVGRRELKHRDIMLLAEATPYLAALRLLAVDVVVPDRAFKVTAQRAVRVAVEVGELGLLALIHNLAAREILLL